MSPRICTSQRPPRPLGTFFFSSRRRHTRCLSDWSSDVCSSDLLPHGVDDAHAPLWRRGRAAVARQVAQRIDYVASILFGGLKFFLPLIGDMFRNLLALMFEGALLTLARVRWQRWQRRDLLINRAFEFVVKIL